MIYKKICKICGKEFECKFKCVFETRKYCSAECSGKVTKNNLINWQKNNPELLSQHSKQTLQKTVKEHPEMNFALKKWREENPQEASELSKQTIKETRKKYPGIENIIVKWREKNPEFGNISSETLKKTWILNRDEMINSSIIGGKKGIKDLLKWKNDNPELAREISRQTFIKTHQNNPELAKNAGAMMHIKCKQRDPIAYSKHQSEAMLAIKRPTNPEKIMQKFLPEDFVFDKFFICGVPDFRSEKRKIIIQVDGPRHYKIMGPQYGEEKLKARQLLDEKQKEIWQQNGYKVFKIKDFIVNDFKKLNLILNEIIQENAGKEDFLYLEPASPAEGESLK